MLRNSPAILLLLITACAASSVRAQVPVPPKREVRAVWIATANALDWPRGAEKADQEESLRRIVASLKAAHFNTIFFQVRARGDAYYHSQFEPWAENLTGVLGKDPGWDPLAFLITEAHNAGLEVHAWFNVFKIRSAAPVGPSVPPHPSRDHALWTQQYAGETWFDPGLPEVREYLLGVALDLIRNYDIDGINLDYARYPGRDFRDETTYRRYGNGVERERWRRENVTAFVSELYDRAIALKPLLKVGSSPLGVYDHDVPAGPQGSYWAQYQDSQGWLHAGKQDYLSPQLYWQIGAQPGEPDFARLIRRWEAQSGGRHIYAGIGAYKSEVQRQLGAQIDSTRASGAQGEALFRLESVFPSDAISRRYPTIALLPAMPWKDSLPPPPPKDLAVTEVAPHVYRLEWVRPRAASDNNLTRSFVIYRWGTATVPFDDPRAIVAVISGADTHYVDSVDAPAGLSAYYAITSLDRGNNESSPCVVERATSREALAFEGKLAGFTTLVTSVSSGDGAPAFAGYTLASRMPVTLELHRMAPDGSDSLVSTLTSGFQERGMYVYGLRKVLKEPGAYILRLKAGGTVLDQDVKVTPAPAR